jgi:hypothetical protein
LRETSVPSKRLIPLRRLIIHFVLVREPRRPQDGVAQCGCFDDIGGSAKRRKIRVDLVTALSAKSAWNFLVDPKRSYKDEPFYPSRIHRFHDSYCLSVDFAPVRFAYTRFWQAIAWFSCSILSTSPWTTCEFWARFLSASWRVGERASAFRRGSPAPQSPIARSARPRRAPVPFS